MHKNQKFTQCYPFVVVILYLSFKFATHFVLPWLPSRSKDQFQPLSSLKDTISVTAEVGETKKFVTSKQFQVVFCEAEAAAAVYRGEGG